MADKNVFDRYLLALRKTPLDEKTEHTDRAALQSLLQALADDSAAGITVQHEPKRVADKGAPDFKIIKRGLILGYVENKAIGESLDKVLKSDQIKRYKSLSQNIVLTDYCISSGSTKTVSSVRRYATRPISRIRDFG